MGRDDPVGLQEQEAEEGPGVPAGQCDAPAVTGAADAFGVPVSGSTEEIADAIRAFGTAGYTQVELLLWPPTLAALEAMAPVVELLDGD